MGKNALKGALVSAASIAALGAGFARAETDGDVHDFSVDAMPLDQAIAEFSAQADVAIFAPAALTSGKMANPVAGRLSTASALNVMLAGYALEASADPSGAVYLVPAAQETDEAEDDVEEVQDVITVTGFRSSFASSLATKRNADQVVDAITAEEIGLFSDQNLTEAVQRISGVQITRNNGEGEAITIRGLNPTFTRVEIDGRTTSVTSDSANPERQSVLASFSSDLFDSIEVIKSPTAADVEGGLGGIVRIKTPNPLDVAERRFGVESLVRYDDISEEFKPGVNGFFIDTFADGRLGLLVSGSFETRARRLDRIENTQGYDEVDTGFLDDDTDPALLALVGSEYPRRNRMESRDGDIDRLNYNAKLQFQATDELRFSLEAFGSRESREEDRSRIQLDWRRGDLQGGTVGNDGTLEVATFDRHRVDLNTFKRIVDIVSEGYALKADFENDDWRVHVEGNLSSSEEDFDEYRAQSRINRDGLGGYDLAGDPEAPAFFTAATELRPREIGLRNLGFQQRIISIEETVALFDVERYVDAYGITSIESGFRYASTEFGRLQGEISSDEDVTLADGELAFVLGSTEFGSGQAPANLLQDWPSVNPEELYLSFPSADPFSFNDENLWSIDEETIAGYVLANYEVSPFGLFARGNFGVRVVQTNYEGSGAVEIDQIQLPDRQILDESYTDVLPSFNFVISKDADSALIVRGAVGKVLTRPTINEINPGLVVNTVDENVEEGNPGLDPFEAWQYDLGVEYYFGENDEGAISFALFYKDVENFINTTQRERVFGPDEVGGLLDGVDLGFQDFPVNGGEARVQGFEFGLQTPLTFLPDSLEGFGIYANYTYTDSEFTTADGVTLDFPGASENSFNIAGYYERAGFSTRLAYTYRDEFLDDFNGADTNNEFTDEQGRLDLAVRYRFENGLRVSFDALNLTETYNYDYWDTTNRLRRREFEGRVYNFALAYIF